MNRVLEVERLGQRDEVVGVRVHLVAVPGLGRAPVPAAVVGDAPDPPGREEDHLRIPVVGAERPAVAEHDGLTLAPVLVVDLRAVLAGDRAHPCLHDSARRKSGRGAPAGARRRRADRNRRHPVSYYRAGGIGATAGDRGLRREPSAMREAAPDRAGSGAPKNGRLRRRGRALELDGRRRARAPRGRAPGYRSRRTPESAANTAKTRRLLLRGSSGVKKSPARWRSSCRVWPTSSSPSWNCTLTLRVPAGRVW